MADARHNGGPPIDDDLAFSDGDAPPFFPFWWEDFWNACRGMRPEEIGGYLAALTMQWKLAGRFTETEMRQMVILTGWDIRTCRTLVAKMVAKKKMAVSADGRITNERMTEEINKFCIKRKAAVAREEKKRLLKVADAISAEIGSDVGVDLKVDLKVDVGVDVGVDLNADLFKNTSKNKESVRTATTTAETTADTTEPPVHARVPSDLQSLREETYAHSAAPNGASVSKDVVRALPRQKPSAEQWNRFWQAYPLRKGKALAMRRFMALDPMAAERAIAGARNYAVECAGREARYVKWAQGWLNERRFEDDAQDAQTGAGVPDPVNGMRWGWWQGKEDVLRAYSVERWDAAIAAAKPNGTWPWWILGAPPGHDECLVPTVLVERYGYREIYQGRIFHA